MATLYRRFPKRSDLVAAVFRREVDACAAEATTLALAHPPAGALALWLQRYARFIAAKRGLAAALHAGDPAFDALPAYFRQNFESALAALLARAAAVGAVRGDVAAYDLLRAVGNLSAGATEASEGPAGQMVDLLIDGLRFGAARPG